MPNIDPLIIKLVEKSEAGVVPWKATAEEDTFIVAIEGELSFDISKLEDDGFAFAMKDADGRKIIDLTSHDPMVRRNPTPEDFYFQHLARLFEAARTIALDVTRKLNAAQNLLDRF